MAAGGAPWSLSGLRNRVVPAARRGRGERRRGGRRIVWSEPVAACQAAPVCGRYGLFTATTAIAEAFAATAAPETAVLEPSRNIAPGMDVAVVVQRPGPARGAGDAASAPTGCTRRVHAARWGLLPSWVTDPAAAFRAFNARSETAAVKPTFHEAMRSFRVVVPASCWYEWLAPDRGPASVASRTAGRPYAVRRADGDLLALAGLCSWWRVPGHSCGSVREGPARHGSWLLTLTVLTRDAGPDLVWLHSREPVVLPDDAVDAWLDPALRDGGIAAELLRRPRPGLAWAQADRAVPGFPGDPRRRPSRPAADLRPCAAPNEGGYAP